MQKKTLENILKEITTNKITENYYKVIIMAELGYGSNNGNLEEGISCIICHGKMSMLELGKEHFTAYYYGAIEYLEDNDSTIFYDYCDHNGIAKNITTDSTYEEFQQYVDHKRLGENFIKYEYQGFGGEYFYEVDGYIFEVVNYDWLSEQDEPENTLDVIVACYEAVNIYLDKGNNLEDAIMYAGEKFKWEAAA